MKALIAKDIASIRKVIFIDLALFLAVGVYAIREQDVMYLLGYCTLIPVSLITATFINDSRSNFAQLAFSMPIGNRDYVLSKLFFAFVPSLIGAIIMFVFLYIKNQLSIDMILIISFLTFIICLLVSALQFPFILKFGAEKGKIFMLIVLFIVLSAQTLLNRNMTVVFKTINTYSRSTIGLAVSFIGLLIIFLCIKFSISIVKNKEF